MLIEANFHPDPNCRWRNMDNGYQIELNGRSWNLTEVAADIWGAIIIGQNLGEIANNLVDKYDAPDDVILADVVGFIEELVSDGLVYEELGG